MTTKNIIIALSIASSLCGCVAESGKETYSPHTARPAKELMTVSVTATIRSDDRADVTALFPDEAVNLTSLWEWQAQDVVWAIYDSDGMTDVCESATISIDGSNPSTATFTFEEIPTDAVVTAIEAGGSSVFGQRISQGTRLAKNMTYLHGIVTSEVGQSDITGVTMESLCEYMRLSANQVSFSGMKFDVSKITISGMGLFGGESGDSIEVDIDPTSSRDTCMVPVSRTAKGISVVASFGAGDKQIAFFDSLGLQPPVCKVTDSEDNTETITVNIEATLDAGSLEANTAAVPEMTASTISLWNWQESDRLYATVLVNGFTGNVPAYEIRIWPSNTNKATFAFNSIPADGKIVSLHIGDSSAYGLVAKADASIPREMMYASANVSSAIGATSIKDVDLKHQCSYLNVFADSVDIDGIRYPVPSINVSGINLKGDGAASAIGITNSAEGTDSLWVSTCIGTTNLQVVANCEASGAMIFNRAMLDGVSRIYRIRPGEVEKVSYRTALYGDGTLVINEMSTNYNLNEAAHGALVKSWAAMGEDQDYVFSESTESPAPVLWADNLANIIYVEFGSATQPSSMDCWFKGCTNLKSISADNLNVSQCESFVSTFANCSSLTALSVSGWNVSQAASFSYMFDGCSSLESLDVSAWDVSNVSDMRFMFRNCKALRTLDVSAWNVSKVTSLKYTFQSCVLLETLDVSKWNTASLAELQGTFRDCTSLKELNVADWDITGVTNLFQVFYNLKITSLDLSKWDTASVTNVENIFSGSNKLASIDISGWDLRSCQSCNNMFRNCSSLSVIYANDRCDLTGLAFNKSQGMFYNCGNLVGANGTRLTDNVVRNNASEDVASKYARVDKADAPGLFSTKE